jgi:hypothetical protein
VWVLGDHSYVWYFLWYSCDTGTEGILKKGELITFCAPFKPIYFVGIFIIII